MSSTWFNTDTGKQKFQIRHVAKMNILETDIVEFEVAFRPGNKGVAQTTGVIGEDSFVCVLSINADDKRFWKATVEEGYY